MRRGVNIARSQTSFWSLTNSPTKSSRANCLAPSALLETRDKHRDKKMRAPHLSDLRVLRAGEKTKVNR